MDYIEVFTREYIDVYRVRHVSARFQLSNKYEYVAEAVTEQEGANQPKREPIGKADSLRNLARIIAESKYSREKSENLYIGDQPVPPLTNCEIRTGSKAYAHRIKYDAALDKWVQTSEITERNIATLARDIEEFTEQIDRAKEIAKLKTQP